MTKLSQDQKDSLNELVVSDAWEAVLAFCQMQVEFAEGRVLTCDIDKNDREIVLLKAKMEGAQDIYKSFYNIRERIGAAKKKA